MLHQVVEKNIDQFMQSCEFSVPDLCVFAAHIDIRFHSFSKCFTKVERVDSCMRIIKEHKMNVTIFKMRIVF